MTLADLPIAAGFPLSSGRETNWFLEDRSVNEFATAVSENAIDMDDEGANSFTLDQSRNSMELTV